MVNRFVHILFVLLAGVGIGHTQSGQIEADIGKEIEERILPPVFIEGEHPETISLAERMEQLNIPGISLAIVQDGEIILAEGYGVVEFGRKKPVSPATLFQAASLSKPLTATAVLELFEKGNIDLDENVNRYLNSWKIPDNEYTNHEPVTIRRLLNHTAGINVHGFPGYPADQDEYPALADVLNGSPLTNTDPVSVAYTPGSHWQYSGGGYTIIQQILEDISGEDFPEYMRSFILNKLGMTESTFQLNLPSDEKENAAIGHVRGNFSLPTGWHRYPEQAAAGLWTTPSDLAKWIIDIQNALTGGKSRLLSSAIINEMISPGLNNWGLGPGINGEDNAVSFTHSGANEGFRSYFVAFTEERHGIVVMTNSDHGSMLIPEIIRTVAYHLDWPDYKPPIRKIVDLHPDKLKKYSGIFELETGIPLEITTGDNELKVVVPGKSATRFLPVSDTVFTDISTDVRIEFLPAASGETYEFKLIIEHYELSGYRID